MMKIAEKKAKSICAIDKMDFLFTVSSYLVGVEI